MKDFHGTRIPAYIVKANFDPKIGTKKSSARATDLYSNLYSKEELLGQLIIGVIHFPPKQIGPIQSEFFVAGFYREDGAVVLAVPDKAVPLGKKLA